MPNSTPHSNAQLARRLEAAERELQIQAAVDHVLQSALRMQASEDLASVVEQCRDALADLGIGPVKIDISIVDRTRDVLHSWGAWDDSESVPRGYRFSLSALRKAGSKLIAPRRGRQKSAVTRLTKRQLASEFSKLQRAELPGNPEWKASDVADWLPTPSFKHVLFFSGGMIGAYYPRELTKPEIAIACRIANAFDVAYRRFVELQQKEQRVRDAEVETALERVRARALGMQHSGDILGVATAMRSEFESLGVHMDAVQISIVDEATSQTHMWTAGPIGSQDDDFAVSGTHGLDRHSTDYKRWKQGVRATAVTMTRKQLGDAMARAWKQLGRSASDIRRRRAAIPDPVHFARVNFAHGAVALGAAEPFSKEETEIACRFVDVFALAYRRFEELQQKEEQNRELIIQSALERVRARALGMQDSSELDEVSVALFDAMADVGIPRVGGILAIGDEEADEWRMSVQLEGYPDLVSAVRPLSAVVAGGKATGAETVEAWRRGDSHFIQETRGELADAVIDYWAKALAAANPDFKVSPDWFGRDRFYVPYVYNRYGAIGMTRFDEPITDDEIDILKRFSKIFEFAYSRFLELQEREQRAHEAQLEAAAERVRAAAMQMRSSADLMDVVGTMHNSLHQLGVEPFSTSIHFVDDEEKAQFQHYLAVRNLEPFGFVLGGAGGVELEAPTKLVEGGWRVRWVRPVSQERLAVWRAGQITTEPTFMEPENYLQPGRTWYVPDPDKADWSAAYRGELDYTVVPFRYGVVTFTVPAVNDQHIATVQTLTEALSLGYMRFRDFQQLERASLNKSQFLRRMSHDLRSPMNAIIGYSRLLLRRAADRLDERELRNLSNIETSSGNLLNLINDILDLSRIEAGRIEVNLQPVDVRHLASECADSLESIVKEGVVLRRDLNDVGSIHSDLDRLRQVVMNLLGNATKFTDAGSITLAVKRVDEAVELSVADTGIGIPPEDLPHIFDEFRQVERQGGEQAEGTGLGLAIAKKTVDLLGGSITATSEVGVGTTFTVRLSAS